MIFGAIIFWQRHSRPNDSLTPAEYESSSLATMSESVPERFNNVLEQSASPSGAGAQWQTDF